MKKFLLILFFFFSVAAYSQQKKDSSKVLFTDSTLYISNIHLQALNDYMKSTLTVNEYNKFFPLLQSLSQIAMKDYEEKNKKKN